MCDQNLTQAHTYTRVINLKKILKAHKLVTPLLTVAKYHTLYITAPILYACNIGLLPQQRTTHTHARTHMHAHAHTAVHCGVRMATAA